MGEIMCYTVNNFLRGCLPMNKTEFIKAVAEKADLTAKDAAKYYEAMIGVIADALKAGDKIQLAGFGSYELKEKPAHTGLNPATGEKVQIAASKAPVFKFGKTYKDSFNA